jgi:hypothetical protein
MITIDITVIIQIINILILIVVMNAVLYKPVRTTLAKRKEKLDGLANAIDTFKKPEARPKKKLTRPRVLPRHQQPNPWQKSVRMPRQAKQPNSAKSRNNLPMPGSSCQGR